MANKVYVAPETAITFKSSGGSATITCTSVATGAGRISAQYDRGAGSKPGRYKWRAKIVTASAATAGRVVELYLSTSDGTIQDGELGTSDAAVSDADYRRNLQFIGVVAADDSAGAGNIYLGSGVCEIFDRYISLVVWNDSGQSLSSTATDCEFSLTPVPDEIQ